MKKVVAIIFILICIFSISTIYATNNNQIMNNETEKHYSMNSLFVVLFIVHCLSFLPENEKTEHSILESSLAYHKEVREVSLQDYLSQKAVNGTVLLMMTDYGYMNMFVNSYRVGNLSQYQNLVVLCIDEQSYRA